MPPVGMKIHEDFDVSDIQERLKYFDLDDVVQYRLEMVEGNGFYRVTIKNLPKAKGNIRGYIKFKTNYAEKPEISIYVRGRFN